MSIKIRWNDIAVIKNNSGSAPITWSDAPYLLCINTESDPGVRDAVWGLGKKMSIEEAWGDYDHADEYEIVDVR